MQIDAAEASCRRCGTSSCPAGRESAARLHLARTVCRRAERLLVDFALDRPVPAIILTYLNRLSDWLFVQARAGEPRGPASPTCRGRSEDGNDVALVRRKWPYRLGCVAGS